MAPLGTRSVVSAFPLEDTANGGYLQMEDISIGVLSIQYSYEL